MPYTSNWRRSYSLVECTISSKNTVPDVPAITIGSGNILIIPQEAYSSDRGGVTIAEVDREYLRQQATVHIQGALSATTNQFALVL